MCTPLDQRTNLYSRAWARGKKTPLLLIDIAQRSHPREPGLRHVRTVVGARAASALEIPLCLDDDVDGEVRLDGRMVRFTAYGPEDGARILFHTGTPSTRLRRPDQVQDIEASGVRVIAIDRPGYGGSSRQPGRTVADAAADAAGLADAVGWERFAVLGGSGGGPHALACAAMLPDRVTRCAVLNGVMPGKRSLDQSRLRAQLLKMGVDIVEKVKRGGPEYPGGPLAPPAWRDPAVRERLRATFVDGIDGWLDDHLALGEEWGFELAGIRMPVTIWFGTHDDTVTSSASHWLLDSIPHSEARPFPGGHLPDTTTSREIYTWLASHVDHCHDPANSGRGVAVSRDD